MAVVAVSAPFWFQSLRGFGVGWSEIRATPLTTEGLFQSLRGFGVGWSAIVVGQSTH